MKEKTSIMKKTFPESFIIIYSIIISNFLIYFLLQAFNLESELFSQHYFLIFIKTSIVSFAIYFLISTFILKIKTNKEK